MTHRRWLAYLLLIAALAACQKEERPPDINPLNTDQWRTSVLLHQGTDMSPSFALAILRFGREGQLIVRWPGTADTGTYLLTASGGRQYVQMQMREQGVVGLLNKNWELLEMSAERIRLQHTATGGTSVFTMVR
jgi:outer membrane biogenesis lipoprotein LolB